MVQVSLEDEISILLNRVSAFMDADHAEAFADLFAEECSVFTTGMTALLQNRKTIQDWHRNLWLLSISRLLNYTLPKSPEWWISQCIWVKFQS